MTSEDLKYSTEAVIDYFHEALSTAPVPVHFYCVVNSRQDILLDISFSTLQNKIKSYRVLKRQDSERNDILVCTVL